MTLITSNFNESNLNIAKLYLQMCNYYESDFLARWLWVDRNKLLNEFTHAKYPNGLWGLKNAFAYIDSRDRMIVTTKLARFTITRDELDVMVSPSNDNMLDAGVHPILLLIADILDDNDTISKVPQFNTRYKTHEFIQLNLLDDDALRLYEAPVDKLAVIVAAANDNTIQLRDAGSHLIILKYDNDKSILNLEYLNYKLCFEEGMMCLHDLVSTGRADNISNIHIANILDAIYEWSECNDHII